MRKFCRCQTVQTHTGFSCFYRQLTVHIGGDPNHELPAVSAARQGSGNALAVFLHICDDVSDDATDPAKRSFRRWRQPTQTGEFRAQPNVFSVFLRPGHSIGVVIILRRFHNPTLANREAISARAHLCNATDGLPCPLSLPLPPCSGWPAGGWSASGGKAQATLSVRGAKVGWAFCRCSVGHSLLDSGP